MSKFIDNESVKKSINIINWKKNICSYSGSFEWENEDGVIIYMTPNFEIDGIVPFSMSFNGETKHFGELDLRMIPDEIELQMDLYKSILLSMMNLVIKLKVN